MSVASRSFAASASQWAAMLVVALASIAADQVTKEVARSQLALGESVDVTSFFSIHHVRNTGIAFGLFPGAASGRASMDERCTSVAPPCFASWQ